MKIRKTTLLVGVVGGLAVAFLAALGSGGGTALADGGPHVATGNSATPDKCAACHRIHTGQAPFLLKSGPTIADFCYSCHGNAAAGSDLNVQGGTYDGNTSPLNPSTGTSAAVVGCNGAAGPTYGGLRAGGFEDASVCTTDSSIRPASGTNTATIGVLATAQQVNSAHAIDPTTSGTPLGGTVSGTMWGNGPISSVAYAGLPNITLSCTSCHDPHGTGTYRILRVIPEGSGAAPGVIIADQTGTKTYTTANYFKMGIFGMTIQKDTSTWCSTCHTRYPQSGFDFAEDPTGDAIFAYQHKSNGVSSSSPESGTACITCHTAHGSNSSMPGTYSSTVPWPGGSTVNPSNDTQRASLLKMDNRGMCRKCHDTTQVP